MILLTFTVQYVGVNGLLFAEVSVINSAASAPDPKPNTFGYLLSEYAEVKYKRR